MALWTLTRTSEVTVALPFITRDTEPRETPASRATSRIVTAPDDGLLKGGVRDRGLMLHYGCPTAATSMRVRRRSPVQAISEARRNHWSKLRRCRDRSRFRVRRRARPRLATLPSQPVPQPQ